MESKNVMSKISYYTKEGLDKLKRELAELKSKGRSDISKQIAEAREMARKCQAQKYKNCD